MTFVCNAGPVIALAKIDHLGLLRDLAKTVLIPETVFFEVLAKPGRDSNRIRRATGEFLSVRNPSEPLAPAVVHEIRRLDAGEKEVITLASAISPPVTAILDDAAGRHVASRLGIPVLGDLLAF
jgi:predicted nucleic acid-binding protein